MASRYRGKHIATSSSSGNVPCCTVWRLQVLLHFREPGFSFKEEKLLYVCFVRFDHGCCCEKKQVGGNNETICALKDVNGSQSLPPVGFILNIIIIMNIINMRELRIDVDHTQGERVCELWRRHRRADLESRGPKTPLGAPISNAWLLLGLCFKYGHSFNILDISSTFH